MHNNRIKDFFSTPNKNSMARVREILRKHGKSDKMWVKVWFCSDEHSSSLRVTGGHPDERSARECSDFDDSHAADPCALVIDTLADGSPAKFVAWLESVADSTTDRFQLAESFVEMVVLVARNRIREEVGPW